MHLLQKLEITHFPALDYASAEAMNTLCTNLMFSGSRFHRIMFTSCRANEGKTYIAMNVARKMAELGKRVMLVDADLRRSAIDTGFATLYAKAAPKGLTHYLSGQCALEEALYQSNLSGLYISPVGRRVSNSITLLNDAGFQKMLDRISETMDYIIIDAPPIGLLIDAAVIAKQCDGTIFVVRANEISRRELVEAKQQIIRSGCQILGAVLNDVSLKSYGNRKYYAKRYHKHYTGREYTGDELAAPPGTAVLTDK
jgi:capsular exopolysaccharide synthesis family protein